MAREPAVRPPGCVADVQSDRCELWTSTQNPEGARSIVARHAGGDYRVAMIGFTPGWSYLSGLEKSLHMPRRQNPRLLTPAVPVRFR